MNQQNILVGADPEAFLVNEAGKFISSVGLIGGSKEEPLPIDGEGCAIQEDNVAVEYNIPACKSADEFIHYNRKVLAELANRVKEHGLSLKVVPSAIFDEDQLDTMAARTFGCDPDYCAWTGGEQNPRPEAVNPNLRSAGGHIHIGNIDDLDPIEIIKAMDLFVGCQMLKFDHDTARRELYGKAGAFRVKKYGVEYRTASNAWIESDERIAWAFNQTEKAVAWVRAGNKIGEEMGVLIQKCINESDADALAIINAGFDIE